jgi:hypothetical protein
MDTTRRRWPRLVLTLPPDAAEALGDMARDHLRDQKREALRLILEGIAREATPARAGAKR